MLYADMSNGNTPTWYAIAEKGAKHVKLYNDGTPFIFSDRKNAKLFVGDGDKVVRIKILIVKE